MKIKQQNVMAYQNMVNLLAYLSGNDGTEVFNKLQRLERKVERIALNYCNIADYNDKGQLDKIEKEVKKLLPKLNTFFINGDPRGYALKFKEEEVKQLRDAGYYPYTDWGGYGILAPEL